MHVTPKPKFDPQANQILAQVLQAAKADGHAPRELMQGTRPCWAHCPRYRSLLLLGYYQGTFFLGGVMPQICNMGEVCL